ncbi:MAG: LysR family transcriptional regulator [Rhodobacteraceae bacterium]|nr:LysR family transcriptional regulator [Paracoccaceae bacterium]
MDIQLLDDVLALLEEGNMTRAAARQHITQPAFSRRIRGFEDWLGTEILDRKSNSIEIGSALAANEGEIRALLSRLRELRTKIAHHDPAGSIVAIAAQHAPVYSTFPDMALRAKRAFPSLKFRLRAGNLSDCVSMFLRGDTSMLLCYEARTAAPMAFGAGVQRGVWGHDYLIPVLGGELRYRVRAGRDIPPDTPAIVYPDNSYFGDVLRRKERAFGTVDFAANPVCQSAFSSGIREMVLKGLGVGWLPFGMAYREVENGKLISLANRYGQEPLNIAIYADRQADMAGQLLGLWARGAAA